MHFCVHVIPRIVLKESLRPFSDLSGHLITAILVRNYYDRSCFVYLLQNSEKITVILTQFKDSLLSHSSASFYALQQHITWTCPFDQLWGY